MRLPREPYRRRFLALVTAMLWSVGCDQVSRSGATDTEFEEPTPPYRNVNAPTDYVGDDACATCHAEAASVYRQHAMAQSFHPWTPETRIEAPLDEPLLHEPTGFYYGIVEVGDELYQEEFLSGVGGRRIHQLRRRMDYVMGSGAIARTYFTAENGSLFQLPLTWYREKGWDFSPGYEVNNARFDRLLPDRCIACHSSYPEPFPFLEGKYAELRPGIGCERCHGPGALHVEERTAGLEPDSTYDDTIVNPKDLPIERRLDVCDQCHVHTPVTVHREGRDAFGYKPSLPLRDHAAFFKVTGSIDIVSHADRLRQSACFLATRSTERPLECATCHDPHQPVPDRREQNQPCRSCHPSTALERRLATSASLAEHRATADCIGCHMPDVKERAVPHGTFTDHWIRVITPSAPPPRTRGTGDGVLEPYFERDRAGSEAAIYEGMGEIVHAALVPDVELLREGAAALEGALGRDTTRADADFLLGVAYRQLGMFDDAMRALERSLRVSPDRPQALHALARAYESVGRAPADIAALYERALELQPALAWIRADYARFLQAQGRREEAEAAYRSALAERPSLVVAAFNLGTLLLERGRVDEATQTFLQAVRLNPMLAEALSSLLQIRIAGNVVTGARIAGSLVPSVPVRSRGPEAVRLTVGRTAVGMRVLFVNVSPGASVRIVEPDGAVVRILRAGEESTLIWDLLTESGSPVTGGLYRVTVEGEEASGASVESPPFWFGVVTLRVD